MIVPPLPQKSLASAHTLPENDWTLPLDVQAELRALPRNGWIRGVFLDSLVQRLDQARLGHAEFPGYQILAKYPIDEYTRLIDFAAHSLYPQLPKREGMRRLGRNIYPAFFDSMVGKAIFHVAGKDFSRAVQVSPLAYAVGVSPGRARVARVSAGYSYVELRDVWGLTEAFQVGVWEGALSAFGLSGTVRGRALSPCDIDIETVWQPR